MKVLIVQQDGSSEVKETGVDSLELGYLMPTPEIQQQSTNLLVKHTEGDTTYYFVVKSRDEENLFNIDSYQQVIERRPYIHELQSMDFNGKFTIVNSKVLREIETALVIDILLEGVR